MKKIIYSIISILLAGFIIFGCLVGADVIKLNNDEKEQEQTQTDETIDITQHERYIALRAQNDALITEKNTLILQLEQKQIELEELQVSSDANDVEKAEHIATLNQEITTMQIMMDVLNNQIVSLQAQLEQIEYVNKTIDDMIISFELKYLSMSLLDYSMPVGVLVFDNMYGGSEFVNYISSLQNGINNFSIAEQYRVTFEDGRENSFEMPVLDIHSIANYSIATINILDTSANQLVLDESYQYFLRDVVYDYELYSLEEATDLNLGSDNIFKTLNVTLKFDVVI